MISNEELLSPKASFGKVKDAYLKEAADYFDGLVAESGMDTTKNDATIQKYNEKSADSISEKKKLSKQKALSILLIVATIVSLIAAVVFGILGANNIVHIALGIALAIVFGGLFVLFIVLNIIGPAKKMKGLKSNINALQKELDELKQQGYTECYALNSLFDYDMQINIFNSVFQDVKLHRSLEPEQFEYFHEKFGLNENDSENHSTVHVQSGAILGNPLLVETAKIMEMGPFTYTGSLVVTYTVKEPDGKGGTTTRTVSETLHASVTKPKPFYNYEKILYYGNEAAPKLSFSRVPMGISKKSEKDQDHFVKSEYKKVQALAKKNVANGFTPLANEEFETMFHAWDRDNEVEFRMLFTPLAQRNLVDIIRHNKPFGDDFIFKKTKMLNVVRTEHSQSVDYVGYPTDFEDFSYKASKDKFLKWNETYFTSLFFDLAPIMSIPLYIQNPASKYENTQKYRGIATNFEVESLVSTLGSRELIPEECKTEVIFKSRICSHNKYSQRCEITAHGFSTLEHVTYVPVTARNGRVYEVPVTWIEYIPLKEQSNVIVIKKEMSRHDYQILTNGEKYQNFIEKYHIRGDQINFCDDFFIVYNSKSVEISDEDIQDLVS